MLLPTPYKVGLPVELLNAKLLPDPPPDEKATPLLVSAPVKLMFPITSKVYAGLDLPKPRLAPTL